MVTLGKPKQGIGSKSRETPILVCDGGEGWRFMKGWRFVMELYEISRNLEKLWVVSCVGVNIQRHSRCKELCEQSLGLGK